MNIADLLPCFPWEGPPLPRFLGIFWPWLQGTEQSDEPLSTSTPRYITSVEDRASQPFVGSDVGAEPKALTTYENIEEIKFPDGFDPDTFMPRTIVVKRKSKRLE
jgi:hypothetical protein